MILGLLALDLGVFHRRAHEPSLGEALAWSGFWVALALAFIGPVYFLYEHNWQGFGLAFPEDIDGKTAALEYFTGYILEKSLSLDNIFVIAVIFTYFGVPLAYQHRVLFWGVLGALVLRGVMIGAGAALVARFDWTAYVFGGLLLLTAVRMLVVRHDNLEPERNVFVRLVRRVYPVSPDFDGQRFLTHVDSRRAVTPLFLVLVLVESTDLLFAVDSIPAIFAVTDDPFLVYTSNVFAILGLRSLYFALAPLLGYLRYLKISLVFVLAFVGVKMILAHHHPIPIPVSLGVIGGILFVGVGASLLTPERDTAALPSPLAGHLDRLARLTLRGARRVVILTIGSTVLLIGGLMIVLPGPALIVIPLGLAILATEFAWARRLLESTRRRMGSRLGGSDRPSRQPPGET